LILDFSTSILITKCIFFNFPVRVQLLKTFLPHSIYRLVLLFCSFFTIQVHCGEKPFLKHEIRAVWIATVSGLDWPKSEDPLEQQQSLRMMVDRLHRAHFNTIFFQVRGRADAMYRSHYEPWSQQLTGTLGQDPHWDPLEFILTEAHARGMEVHAWFNTFLVKTGPKPAVSSPLHVILQHPEWVQQTEDEWWFDPGIPAVRDYVLNVAMDIVKNYDIDGMHFDYIRYPAKPMSDEATYKRYGKGLPKDEWRRENINNFVRAFHDQALLIKPMLKIGSAPLGVYMDIGKGRALQGYAEVFQDSRRWLRERMQDYLAPQVYWSLGDRSTNPDFVLIANDWLKNSYGRQIVVGIGAYKQDVFEEIPSLIDTSRTIGAMGNSFFRYESIHDILDLQGRYRYPATIPPMPWKDDVMPNAPQPVHVDNVVDGIFHIQWQQPLPASDGDRAKYFTVYRSPVKPVDVDDAANILAIIPASVTEFTDTIRLASSSKYYYAVSSLDKGNNESTPAVESVVIPEIANLAKQFSLENKLGRHYPDRVSSVVFIPYEIKERSPVVVKILDDRNHEMLTVVDAVQSPGLYIASADVQRLKTGNYSYVIVAGDFTDRKVLRIEN